MNELCLWVYANHFYLTIGFLFMALIVAICLEVILKSREQDERYAKLFLCCLIPMLLLFVAIDMYSAETAIKIYQNEVFRHISSLPRSEWNLQNDYARVQNIDGKSLVRLGSRTYIAEKKEDGSVFLYTPSGDLAYGISPNGDVWKI